MRWSQNNPSPHAIRPGEHLSSTTEFQTGHIPSNKLPVGSVTIRQHKKDHPRAWVKVAQPNTWILRAIHVWTSNGGQIPPGFVVHHLNHDALDDRVENLALLTRAAHRQHHQAELAAGKEGLVLPYKDLTCSRCQQIYQGKRQPRNGRPNYCEMCAKLMHKGASKQRKDRKREAILALRPPLFCTQCKGPYDRKSTIQQPIMRCTSCRADTHRREVRAYKKRLRDTARHRRSSTDS